MDRIHDTQHEAHEAAKETAALLRSRALAAIRQRPYGLTADQVAAVLGKSVLSIRPRITELKQDGEIVDSGERRANASGRRAAVFVVAADRQLTMF